MNGPRIKKAKLKETIEFRRHAAKLFTDCEAEGNVGYVYVLTVIDKQSSQPVMFVTAEYSDASMEAKKYGLSPYLLCAFEAEGRSLYGNDKDWSDLALFRAEAIDIVRKSLQEELVP